MTQKNKLFSLDKPAEEIIEKNFSGQFISKYLAVHYQKIKYLNDELQRLPAPEEFFFLQSDTSFNAFTFIPLVAKHQGIRELHASTYSINKRVIDALVELHDGGLIDRITLLLSDSLKQRNTSTVEHLNGVISSRPNIEVNYAWNHSKVCIMKTDNNHFIVEGSGNWSENAQYEQYLFANSQGMYDFRMKLFTETKLRN